MGDDAARETDSRKARAQRLAAALRANLTRRKAVRAGRPADSVDPEDAKDRGN
jgi:hypothetical protein